MYLMTELLHAQSLPDEPDDEELQDSPCGGVLLLPVLVMVHECLDGGPVIRGESLQ